VHRPSRVIDSWSRFLDASPAQLGGRRDSGAAQGLHAADVEVV